MPCAKERVPGTELTRRLVATMHGSSVERIRVEGDGEEGEDNEVAVAGDILAADGGCESFGVIADRYVCIDTDRWVRLK